MAWCVGSRCDGKTNQRRRWGYTKYVCQIGRSRYLLYSNSIQKVHIHLDTIRCMPHLPIYVHSLACLMFLLFSSVCILQYASDLRPRWCNLDRLTLHSPSPTIVIDKKWHQYHVIERRLSNIQAEASKWFKSYQRRVSYTCPGGQTYKGNPSHVQPSTIHLSSLSTLLTETSDPLPVSLTWHPLWRSKSMMELVVSLYSFWHLTYHSHANDQSCRW